jgi:CheY-specific phosphatase CheX
MDYSVADFTETLRKAASETLETLAFTEINPREANFLTGASQTYRGSRITLGTLGAMDLVLGFDLLEEIAMVLFNPPTGKVDPEMLDDTLHEILNIVGGRFLESLFNGKSDFALGLPETHLDLKEWNSLPMRWVLVADGEKELAVGINPVGYAS